VRGAASGAAARSAPPDARAALRSTLGRYATGVTVVTATHRGRAAGVTVNAFTSVSLHPPLVMWCLRRGSRSLPLFVGAGSFAVNVLGSGQRDLAARFAGPGDRFHGVPLRRTAHPMPLLAGTVATLVCSLTRLVPAGDHVLLIGEVIDHRASSGPPLLFHDGRYV
jgi:flavin reductase (DIM6/NTAB) family NADH-FMN oxidoreductase RutF